MADFSVTQETRDVYPVFSKVVKLTAKQKLLDNAEIAAEVNKTIATGKRAEIQVSILMMSYDDA